MGKKSKLIKCYHVSPIKNRDSILKHGLLPKTNKTFGYFKKLFFSIDKNVLGLDYVDYINVDIWSFYLPKSKIKKDKNGWHPSFKFTSHKINPKDLKLEETILID